MKKTALLTIVVCVLLTACSSAPSATPTASPTQAFPFSSAAFANGADIPRIYSCAGKNISPALTWGEPPAGTKSFAIVMDDPDAPHGTFLHWVLYDIPASSRGLPEAVVKDHTLPDGSVQGTNDAGQVGYVGPCPPTGTHRYSFRLYAMDIEKLATGFSNSKFVRDQVLKEHAIAMTELIGRFDK